MSMYPIPPDIHEKEKIIGGIFTITQFVFIAIGVALGLAVTLGMFKATSNFIIAIGVGVVAALPFLPFGFIKIRSMGDIELFTYLRYKFKYKISQKEYKSINDNYGGDR